MATSSRLGAVRTALKSALTGHASLSGVAVSRFKPPLDDANALEQIYLDAAAGDMSHGSSSSRFDDITLTLVVKVRKPGGGEDVQAAAEDRALAIFAAAESIIASDTTLSGAILGITPGRYTVEHDADQGNRVVTLAAEIVFITQIDNA